MVYVVINLTKNEAAAFKDKKTAAKEAKCSYSTLHRHLEEHGFYKKGNIRVYITEVTRSNRGNPYLKK